MDAKGLGLSVAKADEGKTPQKATACTHTNTSGTDIARRGWRSRTYTYPHTHLSTCTYTPGAKDAKKTENLDTARKKLVHAMKKGLNLIVSMQQASPPFNDWLNNDESFPALEVFTNCGASLRRMGYVCVGV